jgi:hypothetical protein
MQVSSDEFSKVHPITGLEIFLPIKGVTMAVVPR